MNAALDPMKAALARAQTDAALREGFGLERISLAPPLWHESLTIDGRGNGAIRTLRSMTDASGEAIGEFRSALDPGHVGRLMKIVHDTSFDALAVTHIEAMDMRIELGVLVDGLRKDVGIGLGDPAALDPVQPLLREMDRLATSVRRTHVATLSLALSAPAALALGDAPVRVAVTFKNDGVMGVWIADPASLEGAGPHERMSLLYWEAPIDDPNVAMMPATIEETPLRPVVPAPRPYLWLAPQSAVTREFVAQPSLGASRLHYMRAVFSSYAGSDLLVGRRRLRGCAFSDMLSVAVG